MKNKVLNARALIAMGAMGVLALTGCSSAEPEPVTPSPTPSPTEAPVPIEETPAPELEWWEEAGPGWFMVQVQVGPDVEVLEPGDEHADPGFLTNDLLIAIGPDGQQYDYIALDTMDASYALAWVGTTVTDPVVFNTAPPPSVA